MFGAVNRTAVAVLGVMGQLHQAAAVTVIVNNNFNPCNFCRLWGFLLLWHYTNGCIDMIF